MADIKKNGGYTNFNIGKASWVCPKCRRDTLKLVPHTHDLSFRCLNNKCGFDSDFYFIRVKPGKSYNKIYRNMVRNIDWMNTLIKQGYIVGYNKNINMYKSKIDSLLWNYFK
jgi:hypothetical protein